MEILRITPEGALKIRKPVGCPRCCGSSNALAPEGSSAIGLEPRAGPDVIMEHTGPRPWGALPKRRWVQAARRVPHPHWAVGSVSLAL